MQYVPPFQSTAIPELIREQAHDEMKTTSRAAEAGDSRLLSKREQRFVQSLIKTMESDKQQYGEVRHDIDDAMEAKEQPVAEEGNNKNKDDANDNKANAKNGKGSDLNKFGDLHRAREGIKARSVEQRYALQPQTWQLEGLHAQAGGHGSGAHVLSARQRTKSLNPRRHQVLQKTQGQAFSAKGRKNKRPPPEVKGYGLAPPATLRCAGTQDYIPPASRRLPSQTLSLPQGERQSFQKPSASRDNSPPDRTDRVAIHDPMIQDLKDQLDLDE